jgi:hypothetical protein
VEQRRHGQPGELLPAGEDARRWGLLICVGRDGMMIDGSVDRSTRSELVPVPVVAELSLLGVATVAA